MIKIVQCWDDGVVDDIRLCRLLREHGARASFNLNPGIHGEERRFTWRYQDRKDVFCLALGELRSTYEGFTVANHSLSHPHPTRIPIDRWKIEVGDARKRLQEFFGQEVLGFAYPFGDTNADVAQVVREAGHVYARSSGNATPCFPPADPMFFAPDCHHAAPDFWERFEQAKAAGAPVFYFWGHSYEFVSEEDWRDFEEKIVRFNADPDVAWADLPDVFSGNRNQ